MLTKHLDYQKSNNINCSYMSDFKEFHIIFQVHVCEILINMWILCSMGTCAYILLV